MTIDVMVVDYGVGNLFSVARALEHCGGRVAIVSDPNVVRRSSKVLLPGVGAFGRGMQLLAEKRIRLGFKRSCVTWRSHLGCLSWHAIPF